MSPAWEILCIIRHSGKTPFIAWIQTTSHWLSALAQPDSPPCRRPILKWLLEQSWEPFHHRHCAYAQPLWGLIWIQNAARKNPPKNSVTQISVWEPNHVTHWHYTVKKKKNRLNLECPTKHWRSFLTVWVQIAILNVTPLTKQCNWQWAMARVNAVWKMMEPPSFSVGLALQLSLTGKRQSQAVAINTHVWGDFRTPRV